MSDDKRMANLREWAEGYRDTDGMDQHRRAQVLDLFAALTEALRERDAENERHEDYRRTALAELAAARAGRDEWQIRAEVAEEIAADAVRAEAGLTEAEHRADEWSDEWSRTQANLNEMRRRAERYREALEELWYAVHGYLNERDIDRYDLVTTDRGDNLNAALVHADRELATTAGPGGTQ